MSNKVKSTQPRPKTKTLNIYDDSVLLQPLGKLVSFDPGQLIPLTAKPTDLDRLVLTLAIAYNDLKDLLFWQDLNKELISKPRVKGEVSKHLGQTSGIENHVFRLVCSWLVEVVTLLEKNNSAMNSAIWKSVLSELSTAPKQAWADLITLTKNSEPTIASSQKNGLSEIYRYLVQVRSHGGFHYYQTKPFADGYRFHFNGTAPERTKAYVAKGKNLEESRLFFADAATTATCQQFATGLPIDPQISIPKFVRASHVAIRGIVYEYLNLRRTPFTEEEC